MQDPENDVNLTNAESKLRRSAASIASSMLKYADLPLDTRKQMLLHATQSILNKAMDELIREEGMSDKLERQKLRSVLEAMIDRIFIEEFGFDYRHLGT